MKVSYIILILILFSLSCKKEDVTIEDLQPGVIENKTFNSTVLIDGNEYDGTIIRNCIFENIEGDGLQIRDVNNLLVEKCTFRNISGDAVRFRNSGTSNNVQLYQNQIYNIEENGILAPEDHTNAQIIENTIYNVATNGQSALIGAPHHGIYWQGENVTISKNTIYNVINNNGNCVSIRTNGTVARNTLFGATDHGISYFSDHPAGNTPLLIENNLIYDNGMRGVNLASNGENNNHISTANVRCNTLISEDQSPIGVNDDLNDVTLQFTGNILIRTDGANTFIFSSNNYFDEDNLTASNDIGFVNYATRDLRLTASSVAKTYVSNSNIPNIDFDGDGRTSPTSAGAYE